MTNDLIESLSRVPLFSKLGEERLKKIATIVETVQFADGQMIFSEGSSGDSLYIVDSGEVSILKFLSKADSAKRAPISGNMGKVVATLQKGDFFGEMALLDQVPRSASARAKGQASLFKIERESFWSFVKSNALDALETIILLARTMSERLRLTTLESATIFELGKIFSSGLTQKELAAQIIHQVKTLLPEKSLAALSVWNEFNEEFEWFSVSHPDAFPVELRRTLSRAEPIPNYLEEKRTYFLSDNWKEESRFDAQGKNLYGAEDGTRLAVPLFKTEETQLLSSGHWIVSCPLLGFFFCLAREKNAAFDRQWIHLLNTIAHLSAVALENSAHREEELARIRYAQQRQAVY